VTYEAQTNKPPGELLFFSVALQEKTFSLLPQSFPMDFSISFGASSQISPVSDCFQFFAMLCFTISPGFTHQG